MKFIPLTQGRWAVVDDDDFDRINAFKWFTHSAGYAVRNARTGEGKRGIIYMHREVLGISGGAQVDHKNGETFDNRRKNLRVCDFSQNQQNRKRPMRGKAIPYKGVDFTKSGRRIKRWRARIVVRGTPIALGRFLTAADAARAYDAAAAEHFGSFASLNFEPED